MMSGKTALAVALLFCGCAVAIAGEQPSATFTRDLQVDVCVNQIGYTPGAHKRCVVLAGNGGQFQVIALPAHTVSLTGELHVTQGDFGTFGVGDFSAVTEPGVYYIRAGQRRSYPFRIDSRVYDDALRMIVRYFSLQRCGPSTTGYLTPCHLDDGVRLDNGKRQDVTGGWHDASDLRKWMGATIHGMIGLGRLSEVLHPDWDHGQIADELDWGNRYFLRHAGAGRTRDEPRGGRRSAAQRQQSLDGQLGRPRRRIGATIPPRGQIVGQNHHQRRQGRPRDTDRAPGSSRAVQVRDRAGPRGSAVQVACPRPVAQCLQAAEDCFQWCRGQQASPRADALGAEMQAAVELLKATGRQTYADVAIKDAAQLRQLQVSGGQDQAIRGFFRQSPRGEDPAGSMAGVLALDRSVRTGRIASRSRRSRGMARVDSAVRT